MGARQRYEEWRAVNGPPRCAGHTHLFYAGYNTDGSAGRTSQQILDEQLAISLCRTCPVRELCADMSIIEIDGEQRAEPGIWGGMTLNQRCKHYKVIPIAGAGTKHDHRVGRR